MQKIAKSIKKHLITSVVAIVLTIAGVVALMPAAQADTPQNPTCGSACCGDKGTDPSSPCIKQDDLSNLKTAADNQNKATTGITCPNKTDCGSIISKVVNPLINLMTALVGIVVTISLIVAGITYSAAGGDPGKVAAAKKRITNSIIALIAYIFTFGMLQWLIPGGLL